MKEKILRSNAKYQAKVESLLQELSTIPEDDLNRIPANGGWSALQTAWHLLLIEENSMLYIQKKLGYGGEFEKAGLASLWRICLILAVLYSPIRIKAPKGVSGELLPAHSKLPEINERWKKARTSWTDFFSQIPENLLDKAVYKHPLAGRLGWMHTMQFIHAHFDHHLRQIRRALA